MFSLNNSVHASTGASPAALNYGRQPLPPATTRREQEHEAFERREREAVEDWAERLQDMDSLQKRAAAQAADEQRRQAAYYNAHRREVSYEVGDLVMKRNRVLSSAAQGISAKLALKYAENRRDTGSNTVRVIDEKDASEETLHVSHLKPYYDESSNESGEEVDDVENTRPLREETSVAVTSDPPEVGGAPPSDARPVEKHSRGRPRKTVRIVKRAVPRKACVTTIVTVESKKPRGRRKGSTTRSEPKVNRDISPWATRAQRRAKTSGQSMSSGVVNDSD